VPTFTVIAEADAVAKMPLAIRLRCLAFITPTASPEASSACRNSADQLACSCEQTPTPLPVHRQYDSAPMPDTAIRVERSLVSALPEGTIYLTDQANHRFCPGRWFSPMVRSLSIRSFRPSAQPRE
jgi:hypothetical protein